MKVVSPENTYAVIIAVEEYQFGIKKVEYATNDAKAFKFWLNEYLGVPDDNIKLWINTDVTKTRLEHELKYEIQMLQEDDRFIFYYAGHGFFDNGQNKFTAWDTHPENLKETSVSLNKVLMEPLRNSPCNKSLLFVDSCSSFIEGLDLGRDFIAGMRHDEFIEFIRSSNYRAAFFSCSRGEKSYGSLNLKHGIWTYHLLQALKGEVDEAIDRQFITSSSLQNYLSTAVPRYIRERTEIRGNQNPWAEISSSNTFAIYEIPADDNKGFSVPFAGLGLAQEDMFFRKVEMRLISKLPGYSKSVHFVPNRLSRETDQFISNRMDQIILDEIEHIYNKCKSVLGLRRKDITRSDRNIDTRYFRFSIDTRQNPNEPSEALIIRKLYLNNQVNETPPEGIENVFPIMPNEIVFPVYGEMDYNEIVDKFEDVEEQIGGTLEEDENSGLIEYSTSDGVKFILSTNDQELIMKPKVSQNLTIMLATVGQSFHRLADADQKLIE
ncbi:Caspase domain-containing protein [Paenibacillus polysaccharolyticus]|uniref:Caspase domain-containing protein n=1 Tax=Paenibacillus polysaccharolyticus TaxID=582692 RepID=A0A1G5AUL2_9BACL|nr:caspase family protein [Paenibacillus polysaccharolyticus]SCX81582.1 Caspase domain-containing protein [Paenibacillus polysaccharolyticus]